MEDIIKKAIEGGWTTNGVVPIYQPFSSRTQSGFLIEIDFKGTKLQKALQESETVLDPLFWQSLGKVCGWKKYHADLCDNCLAWERGKCTCADRLTWVYQAMNFHEINLTESWEKAVEYLIEITTPQ